MTPLPVQRSAASPLALQPSLPVKVAAWLAPATAAPSATWRLLTLAGVYGETHPVTVAMRSEVGDVLLVSLGSVGLLSLTIGLVREWGVRFPAWVWGLGGKRVPPLLALVPAYVGGGALFGLALFAVLRMLVEAPSGEPVQLDGAALLVAQLAYAPLLFSGALVLFVARDYQRRRRGVL